MEKASAKTDSSLHTKTENRFLYANGPTEPVSQPTELVKGVDRKRNKSTATREDLRGQK